MTSLWDVDVGNADRGYLNISAATVPAELRIRDELDTMWRVFEPYADDDFRHEFARQPYTRFWEMHLAWQLLTRGKNLLTARERRGAGGQPDICVVEGDRRIWIEAIAPAIGAEGPDQVRGPEARRGAGVAIGAMPTRQVELRVSSALRTKAERLQRYLESGRIAVGDVRLIAIGGSQFAPYALDYPIPTALSAVFPIGNAYATVDTGTGEVVDSAYHYAPEITRTGAVAVPRTSFLQEDFAHVSGIVWSRASIGTLGQPAPPLTLIHNPLATLPMAQRWGAWDREFVTAPDAAQWRDILNGEEPSS